jgi:dynactin-5
VLPPETVVPPFAIMSGSPAYHVSDLPEATPDLMMDYTRSLYNHFIMVKEVQADKNKKNDSTTKLVEL